MDKRFSTARNDRGFTLIELLVVIIIIGILAAVAIPAFLNQRKKAVDASAKADARSIATELETFFTDSMTYPTATQVSYTAPDLTIGSDKVVMSPGNTPTVKTNASANAICIEVASAKASRTYVWLSNEGGLSPSLTACPADFTVTL